MIWPHKYLLKWMRFMFNGKVNSNDRGIFNFDTNKVKHANQDQENQQCYKYYFNFLIF